MTLNIGLQVSICTDPLFSLLSHHITQTPQDEGWEKANLFFFLKVGKTTQQIAMLGLIGLVFC